MFKRYWWMLLVMVPVGMLAGWMVAAAITYSIPKEYESSAVIDIKPGARLATGGGKPSPDNYQGTERKIITPRNNLMRVVEVLDLPHKWGMDRESAIQMLKSVIQTESIRGTDLIQIRVRHGNREDARDIAAEAARAYREYRNELNFKSIQKGISEIKKAVREQEDRVVEKRGILTSIVRIKGEGGGAEPLDAQGYADAKIEFETEASLLEQLKLKLVTEEIYQGLPGDVVVIHDDPMISDFPVSPNVRLNLLIGIAVGALVSPFLALPVMWMMNRRNGRDGLSEPSGSV